MLVALFTVVTVAPGVKAAEGSVIVLRNEVERLLRPSEAAKADEQKQECERLTERAHAYSLQKNTIPVAPARERRDSLLPAEARIHFRSYKSAEFLFRGGKTRLLINKRGLPRDQVDKLGNFFRGQRSRTGT
jgi:hypothetical protein